ncbi:MAG TPA: S8 family serine peptidase, partial [Candidatus Eisenbacteria bacterium]|nr:S8 family serine peptidase [Candidatus Eisenbacteria bacterium]
VADSFGHGTTVVGVMAARTNNGATFDTLGVAGVCGGDGAGNAGCRILALKITAGSTGSTDSWTLARAILAAAAAGARAVNVSFAGGGTSRLERLAMQQALAQGCVSVCAAGNHGALNGDTPQYPAAYAAEGVCIQVGACDATGQRAAFSSYGPGLDVIAPGVGIWTTFMTYPSHAGASYPGYVASSGTSLAAPFGTGTVGLLAAARPELEDTDFQQLLRRTASDVGAPGFDPQTGAGLLDAGAALAAVDPGIGIWHGVAAATQFTPLDVDTLVSAEDHVVVPAQAFRATVTVALPDSFASTAWAWARVTGTGTLPEGFRLSCLSPHADVRLSGRALALSGCLYRATADGTWYPAPPESARIAFTVMGPVLRTNPIARHRPLVAAPNPFTGGTRLAVPAGAPVDVLDVAGRRRRTLVARADGSAAWDGRDQAGRMVPAGIYFVRVPGAPPLRLVRLE